MRRERKLALLNSPILTSEGTFTYKSIRLEEARSEVSEASNMQSAIGHASTAEILTELLGVEVKVNRVRYTQDVGEAALVFRLTERPPEGAVLSRSQLEEIGYEFGLLERIE